MRLDTAYANADFIPGAADFPPRWEAEAAAFRERETLAGRSMLNQPYGPGARQAFDLFLPESRPVGLIVFIHGGYWLRFGRETWSAFAAGPCAAGWAVAMPSYTLAPAARIHEITAEIARALDAAVALVPRGPLRITGHSAGGHLSARMACEDVELAAAPRLDRVVPISPLADLGPLMETSMNADLRIDAAEARAESPIHHAPRKGVAVTVWVGAAERPAFLDQARWLSDAWGARLHIDPGRHHFDVIDALADAESPLTLTLTS